ncbi:MAG: protein kinase [Pyrinomonadaceae bacterium]
MPRLPSQLGLSMVHSSNESQQTRTFSIDHENVLPDHYRLIELIGRGGMAEVYLAEDRRLGRKVAIKFLNSEFRRDPDRVRRFRQEARSASALNHPNILIIHDIGDRGGIQFIVSEFVEGETLGTRIAQGRVPFAEAVDIAIQAASALTAAHAAGIVHRDIKPDNVMIRHDGAVKVLDFGLAKARGFTTLNGGDFDALTLDSGSTSPGLIVGTPQYMSPEQARGKELDGRTDIFSLGIIIFEMVTRHSPFAGGSFADTMAAILTKEPRRMDEFVEAVPERLIALVEKCLKKNLEERFSSMAELEAELKLLKTELAEDPRDTAEVDPAKSDRTQIRPTHQHSIRRFVSSTFKKPSPIAAVIILVAAGLLAAGWWAWDRVSLRSASPSLMRTVPITSWSSSASELVTSASFSPDGKLVAFSARKGDSTEIWVKPVVGGDPVQVTKNGSYNQYPIWSPDGQEIAFYSEFDNSPGIWRTPFTGGPVAKMAAVERTFRPLLWGKDGTLFFESRGEMFRANGSGVPEQATNFRERGVIANAIRISDDESYLAYSSKENLGWKLNVQRVTGGAAKSIGTSPNQIDHIEWHPSGQSVFASFSVEQILHVVEASTNGESSLQRSNGDTNFVVHDVSRDGAVLYSSLAETSDLWKIDTTASKETIVANEVSLEFWPDIAADGSISYQAGTHSERPDLASIKTAPGSSVRSSNVDIPGFLPSWSNDREWIAFIRRREAVYELWKSRSNGTDQTRLNDSVGLPNLSMAPYFLVGSSNIAWSPDDKKIAVVGRDQNIWHIRIVDAETPGPGVSLVSEPSEYWKEASPFWTRDGRSVVASSNPSPRAPNPEARFQIHSTNVADGYRRQLHEGLDPVRIIGLSSEGSDVLFALRTDRNQLSPTPPNTEIYSVSLNKGGQPRKIGTLESAYFNNIHLAKDGRVLAYVRRSGDLVTILTRSLTDGAETQHLVVNDPKILISNLGLSDDGRFIVFGKQTRTKLLSMLTQ